VRAFQEKLNIIAMLSLSLCSLVNQNWPRERSFVYMMRAGHKERAASKQERCVRAAISGRFGASRAGRVRRDRAGAEKFGIRTALYLFGVLRHRSNARRKLDAQQRFESGQRQIFLLTSAGRASRAASMHARGDLPSACSIVHSVTRSTSRSRAANWICH